MARLQQFFHDPGAPAATAVLPAAFAVVRNDEGLVLLVKRADDDNWELPGGRIDVEGARRGAVVREVAEEAGVDVELTGLAGVYSDPGHVLVYAEGARQQLAVCFHAVPARTPRDVEATPDDVETVAAGWFDPRRTARLAMHPTVRARLQDATTRPDRPHFD